jgi:predicted nucleotidyltransferase
MKTKMELLVEEIMSLFPLTHFIGGSRRWDNWGPTSDWDIFVSTSFSPDRTISIVLRELDKAGYRYTEQEISYLENFFQIQIENCIHVTFLPEVEYIHLREEHNKMEEIFNDHFDLVQQMRTHGIDGKTRYRILRDAYLYPKKGKNEK